ncbi:MAG: hypothetical protein BGO50_10620 [Rhodanobacter sp. 67-28]|nr:MAG: hypothetical protein BGO50_10620 [Rhodanobacter sp. 67-28]
MAYANAYVRVQLETIATQIPRLIAVSTDIILNPRTNTSHHALTVYRRNGTSSRVDITERVQGRAVEQLMSSCSLSPSAAAEVAEVGKRLYQVNPRGAWCMTPEPSTAPLILSSFEASDANERSSYALSVVDRLAELMPHVAKVIGDSSGVSNVGGGRIRKRTWIRFEDAHGQEVAAIDTSVLQAHARDACLRVEHEHLEVNLRRLSLWSKQLGIEPVDVPGDAEEAKVEAAGEVMSLLAVAMVTLAADELWLHAPQ